MEKKKRNPAIHPRYPVPLLRTAVGSLDGAERWSGKTTFAGLGLGVGFRSVVQCWRDAAGGIWIGAGYRGIAFGVFGYLDARGDVERCNSTS